MRWAAPVWRRRRTESSCTPFAPADRNFRPSQRHLVLGVASAALALLACVTSAQADVDAGPGDEIVVSSENANGGTTGASAAGASQDSLPGSTSEQPAAPQVSVAIVLASLADGGPSDTPSAGPNTRDPTADPASTQAGNSADEADVVGTGVPQPMGNQNPQVVPASGGAASIADVDPGQRATATADSVQTNPTNSSITVVIGTAANTQGTAQSNAADAAAAANTGNVAPPPEAATSGANQVPESSSLGDQTAGVSSTPSAAEETDAPPAGQSAGGSTDVANTEEDTSGTGADPGESQPRATTTAMGRKQRQERRQEQQRSASASSRQHKPSNKNVEVRVGAPGGAVRSTRRTPRPRDRDGSGREHVADRHDDGHRDRSGNTGGTEQHERGDSRCEPRRQRSRHPAQHRRRDCDEHGLAGVRDGRRNGIGDPDRTVQHERVVRVQSPGADGVVTQQSTSTQSTQAGAANAPGLGGNHRGRQRGDRDPPR